MSNNNILQSYIEQFKLIYKYTTIPDDIIIINHDYRIEYSQTKNKLNIDSNNISLFEVSLFKQYEDIITHHTKQYLYCEFNIPHESIIFKLKINKIKNDVDILGWAIFISPYCEENIFFKLLNRTNFSLGLQQFPNKYIDINQLTDIQQIICYLILYNLSNEAITKLIHHLNYGVYKNISKKSIERHLEILKQKFAVHSKVELIDLLIKNHYYRYIPKIIVDGLANNNSTL